jgi:hypothetical protein
MDEGNGSKDTPRSRSSPSCARSRGPRAAYYRLERRFRPVVRARNLKRGMGMQDNPRIDSRPAGHAFRYRSRLQGRPTQLPNNTALDDEVQWDYAIGIALRTKDHDARVDRLIARERVCPTHGLAAVALANADMVASRWRGKWPCTSEQSGHRAWHFLGSVPQSPSSRRPRTIVTTVDPIIARRVAGAATRCCPTALHERDNGRPSFTAS